MNKVFRIVVAVLLLMLMLPFWIMGVFISIGFYALLTDPDVEEEPSTTITQLQEPDDSEQSTLIEFMEKDQDQDYVPTEHSSLSDITQGIADNK